MLDLLNVEGLVICNCYKLHHLSMEWEMVSYYGLIHDIITPSHSVFCQWEDDVRDT